MSIPSSPPPSSSSLSLQAFHEAAAHQTDVYLDGERLVLLGSGKTPQGRQIDWVAPAGDTSGALIRALNDAVGAGLGSAIARELSLTSAPGKPLSARTIERAVNMANEGMHMLEGVDFMTQLRLSAQNGTPDFIRLCTQAGIDPQQLDATTRKDIDDMLAQRFQAAAQTGHVPVSDPESERWLTEIIQSKLLNG